MDGGTHRKRSGGSTRPRTRSPSSTTGLNPGAALGRIAVGPDGNLWFGDKGTTPAIVKNPTTHAIILFTAGLNAGSLPGGIWRARTATSGSPIRGRRRSRKAIGRVGVGAPAASVTAPSVAGPGGVNIAHTCGGDVWSTWAGQQPSHKAFGFDGYQWLLDAAPIAGARWRTYTPTAAESATSSRAR